MESLDWRIVVRWSGLDRKGYIKIGDTTRHFSKPLSWLKVFDLFYIPEAHHLEARDLQGDAKRELSPQELQTLAQRVRDIGAIIRPVDDLL